MTIFDLLFLALAVTAIATVIVMLILVVRGRWARAYSIPLAVCGLHWAYVGIVYVATAFAGPVVREIGEAQCSDDWCLAVDAVNKTPDGRVVLYELTMRIFSKACRTAQRESIAEDVYLVDSGRNSSRRPQDRSSEDASGLPDHWGMRRLSQRSDDSNPVRGWELGQQRSDMKVTTDDVRGFAA